MFSNTAPLWANGEADSMKRVDAGSIPAKGIGETQQNNERGERYSSLKIFVVNIERPLTHRAVFVYTHHERWVKNMVYSDISAAIHDVTNMAKAVHNQELSDKVFELSTMLMDLSNENMELKHKVDELQQDDDFQKNATFRDGDYWIDGDDIPFCARCWEADRVKVHLVRTSYGTWMCPNEIYNKALHEKK